MAQQASSGLAMNDKGLPFLSDTHDMFCCLILSLPLETHKQYFKSFHHCFSTEQGLSNLMNLRFSESVRVPDKDTGEIKSSTTTMAYSMHRSMAKDIAQLLMDARLIENASDSNAYLFKDRALYQCTPKGLHILERFIARKGVSAPQLVAVFASQPICAKLLHIERDTRTDDLILTEDVIVTIFKRFAGRSPNYPGQTGSSTNSGTSVLSSSTSSLSESDQYYKRSNGIPLQDTVERSTQMIGRGQSQTFSNTFGAARALEWIVDFTCVTGRDEAALIAGHFLRCKLITSVTDHRRFADEVVPAIVRGDPRDGACLPEVVFYSHGKMMYQIAERGMLEAKWMIFPTSQGSPTDEADSNTASRPVDRVQAAANERSSSPSGALGGPADTGPVRASNTDHLRKILNEPALRSLFRDFLKSNYCEENLSFWLEVSDFKRRFSITSSASAGGPALTSGHAATDASSGSGGGKKERKEKGAESDGHHTERSSTEARLESASAKHHRMIVQMMFAIYNDYIALGSMYELNIDHSLRNELVNFLDNVIHGDSTSGRKPGRPLAQAGMIQLEANWMENFTATKVSAIMGIFHRMQLHVFRLMSTDSVPKFINTRAYLELKSHVEDVEELEHSHPASFANEQNGYLTHESRNARSNAMQQHLQQQQALRSARTRSPSPRNPSPMSSSTTLVTNASENTVRPSTTPTPSSPPLPPLPPQHPPGLQAQAAGAASAQGTPRSSRRAGMVMNQGPGAAPATSPVPTPHGLPSVPISAASPPMPARSSPAAGPAGTTTTAPANRGRAYLTVSIAAKEKSRTWDAVTRAAASESSGSMLRTQRSNGSNLGGGPTGAGVPQGMDVGSGPIGLPPGVVGQMSRMNLSSTTPGNNNEPS